MIVAALLPIVIVGLVDVGGWNGVMDGIRDSNLGEPGLHALEGTQPGNVTNPIGSSWIGLVFGLGFVLSFGYWTTNFAEVQRALSAKDLSAAQRTPLIGAFPKLVLPFIMIVPGLIALIVIPNLGSADDPNLAYNNALPLLMNQYLPNGMLGLAITGLMASFMAGVAANVSAFNTVVTTDLMEPYVRPGESDEWYVRFGRIATIAGLVVAMGTALIASTYDNLMNYVQALFSIFNAPLFAVFIIGMFWKRMTPWAGFWGLVAGTTIAGVTWIGYKVGWFSFGSDLDESMWGARPRLRGRRDRRRRRDDDDHVEADRRAAGPGLRHGERGRVRRPPRVQVVGVAEAARLQRARGRGHPDHHLLVAHV